MSNNKYKWEKPLSEHTKKDCYECYAKIVLEEMFSDKFNNLKIEDKPDLQSEDNNYGIEVTRAIDKKEIEADKMYSKTIHNKCRNTKKVIEKYSHGKIRIKNGILSSSGKDSFDLILKSFCEKVDKLNDGNYKNFKQNYLFIFSDILADDYMLKEALENMYELQKKKNRKFSEVFVLVPGNFYNFNLQLKKYHKYKIENSQQDLHSCKARELVEIYENI